MYKDGHLTASSSNSPAKTICPQKPAHYHLLPIGYCEAELTHQTPPQSFLSSAHPVSARLPFLPDGHRNLLAWPCLHCLSSHHLLILMWSRRMPWYGYSWHHPSGMRLRYSEHREFSEDWALECQSAWLVCLLSMQILRPTPPLPERPSRRADEESWPCCKVRA